MSDLKDAIETNAAGPAKASGDAGAMEQHKLSEQIAADKYLASKQTAHKKHLGLRFFRMRPPGTV